MADNNSSKLFLAVALVLGVLATVMALVFINKTAEPDGNKTVEIVVAARDLRSNAPLDPTKDFKKETIPAKYAAFANRVIDPRAMANYKGEMLDQSVDAGQPIFLADLSVGDEVVVKEPNRLVTIPANPGIVECGDYVKVANQSGLLIGGGPFRVVAIGAAIKRARNPATIKLEEGNRNVPKTISLEVTEPQALELDKGISPSPDRNFLIICPPPSGAATRP